MFAELGDRTWQARTHQELGVAAYFEGDVVMARSHYEASLALSRALGDELGVVCALNDLGEVALQSGDLENARSLQAACLEIARRAGDRERIAMALAALAGLAAAQGRPTRAVRLAAAALALNEATGQRNSPAWHALLARWLEPAYTALSPEAHSAAQAAGRSMSLDAAIDEALAWLDASEPGPRQPEQITPDAPTPLRPALAPVPPDDTGLSPRELEVAALVAQGMTNRQIAHELVIAEGTAASHVKHILARLVLDSRVQIAIWAIDHGLDQRPMSTLTPIG
jgi:DNA-binding CsgD family transcriptional regulator